MANLSARRLQLKETLNYLKNSQREYDSTSGAGDYIDALDSAQREISSANLYSLIERKNRELRKVEQLMSRLANEEEFGMCEECGEPIRQERLLIMPDATLCVPCQRELERWNFGNAPAGIKHIRWKNEKESPWDEDNDLDAEDQMLIDIHGAPVSPSDDGDLDPENSLDGSI
jgi:DnaK suppressor protein